MSPAYNLIIGRQLLAGAQGTFDVLNPATEQPVGACPKASVEQLDQAVAAAQLAFEQWKLSSHAERQRVLNAIADQLEKRAGELARIIVQEQGKPLFLAPGRVQRPHSKSP